MAIPLVSGDLVVGLVCATSNRADAFSAAECAMLVSLGPTVAAAMRNATAVSRTRTTWMMRRELETQKALFLSLVSAELRDPLAAIAELCQRMRAAPPAEVQGLAAEVLDRGYALSRLTEEVLEISVSHAEPPHVEPVDCRELLASLGRTEPGPPVMVVTDPVRLQRVAARLAPGRQRIGVSVEGETAVLSFPAPIDEELLNAMARLINGAPGPGTVIRLPKVGVEERLRIVPPHSSSQ